MSFVPDFSAHGYQVIEELGQNTQGGRVAYRAQDRVGNQVVIKQFQFAKSGQDWSGFRAIEREMQVLKGLEHKNIPPYIESFETNNGFCLVTRYIKSQTLAVMRSFDPDQIKQIAVQILEILVYLQNRIPPIIHRDIKPENILIDDDLNVYLIDFGFARVGGGEVNMSSVTAGSFGFMAPEQVRNLDLSKASDLYGFGMTLICLLGNISSMKIGEYIDARNQLDRKKIIEKLSDYSLDFIDWLNKLVEPEPKDRFPNAAKALESLNPLSLIRLTDVKPVKDSEKFDLKLQETKNLIATSTMRSSMRQFPIILIPPEVQRIAQSKPVAPEFNPKLPSPPVASSPDPIDIREAFSLTGGLMFLVVITSLVAMPLAMMILIVGTIAIVLRVRLQFQTYKKRSQNYQAALQRYLLQLESYSREEVKYQSELAIAHSPTKILGFRQQQFRGFFKKLSLNETAIALSTDSHSLDVSIYDFGIKLQKYLSGTVYEGVNLSIPNIKEHWTPALVYVEPALNAHIAIEIISSSQNGAAIANDLLERVLVNSGWIIIKFSQGQISGNSAACCKEFAKLLDRLSLDITVLPSFADISDLAPVKLEK